MSNLVGNLSIHVSVLVHLGIKKEVKNWKRLDFTIVSTEVTYGQTQGQRAIFLSKSDHPVTFTWLSQTSETFSEMMLLMSDFEFCNGMKTAKPNEF